MTIRSSLVSVLCAAVFVVAGYAQSDSLVPPSGPVGSGTDAELSNEASANAPAVTPAPLQPAPITIKADEESPAGTATRKTDASGQDTLSVDFPDEDIRNILRNVADLFDLNLVVPESLQGRSSVKLRDVTWRQIFTVILKPVGYAFVETDNIVKIVSLEELESEPFVTRTFSFENVAAGRIKPLVESMLTVRRDGDPTKGIPPRPAGSIVVNELANELIVTDQPTVVTRVGEMARRLDTEPKQVVIETKFVEISEDGMKTREIALGYRNPNAGFDVRTGVGLGAGLNTSTPFTINSGTLLGGSPTAIFNQNDFSALVNMLNGATNVRLVTNPTIVAINGSKSDIKIGRELQLVTVTTTTSGSTPVTTASAGEIKFVGISLEVTPQITGNKLIALNIKPVKSSVFNERSISGNTFYDIDKREGELNVILRDGQTAAIGGLIDTTTRKEKSKVPVLGDIPLLGGLFRTTRDIESETNLIVFITATVLEPSKMKYDNVIAQDQLDNLALTRRDILGRNYLRSAEEQSLLDESAIRKQEQQDAAVIQRLERARALGQQK